MSENNNLQVAPNPNPSKIESDQGESLGYTNTSAGHKDPPKQAIQKIECKEMHRSERGIHASSISDLFCSTIENDYQDEPANSKTTNKPKPFDQSQILTEGMNRLDVGDFKGALEKFNQFINSGQRSPQAIKLKAVAFFFDNKFNSSADCYQQLIQEFPSREEGFYGKGLSLALMGQFQEAKKLFEAAINLNDQNWRCYFCKGYYKIKTKCYDEAFDLLEKAITKNKSEYPIGYIARAELFCYRGNFPGARKDIQYAKKAVNQNDTLKMLYSFQVESIRKNIEKYEEMIQKLDNESCKFVTQKKRDLLQVFLTKNLSRSALMNNQPVFDRAIQFIQKSLEETQQSNMISIPSSHQAIIEGEEPTCECNYCNIC